MSSRTVSHLKTILSKHSLYKPSFRSQFIETEGVFQTSCKVFVGTHILHTSGSNTNEAAAIEESANRMCHLLGIKSRGLFSFKKGRGNIANPYWKILCQECCLRNIKTHILLINSAIQYKIRIQSQRFTSRLSSLTLVCLQAITAVQKIQIRDKQCVDYIKYDKNEYSFPWEDVIPESEEETTNPNPN